MDIREGIDIFKEKFSIFIGHVYEQREWRRWIFQNELSEQKTFKWKNKFYTKRKDIQNICHTTFLEGFEMTQQATNR